MAVTMSDIYPGEDWNFVYGQARLDERTGVFSFARHSPHFNDGDKVSDSSLSDYTTSQLGSFFQSCSKTLHHEILHMLQFKHCIYYRCLINGSNGPNESSGAGLECVVCEKKLIYFMSLHHVKDITSETEVALHRYKEISRAWLNLPSGWNRKDKDWVDERIRWLEGGCICVECRGDNEEDVFNMAGEESEEEETKIETCNVEVTSTKQLEDLLSSISPTTTSSTTFESNNESTSAIIVAIQDYALPSSATLPKAAYVENIGNPMNPNLHTFLFSPSTVSSSAHFDWWIFPGKYNGRSLFPHPSSNVFRCTDKTEFIALLNSKFCLEHPSLESHLLIPYPFLVLLSLRNLLRHHSVAGIRLQKIHVFLNNVQQQSKIKSVIVEATAIAADLPRCRVPKEMLF